jgi:short-subunit dehydrogenase
VLKQSAEGHVVNTASVAGLLPGLYRAIYHATKDAVVTITESLHHELSLLDCKLKVSVAFARLHPNKHYGVLQEPRRRIWHTIGR